MPNEEHKKRTDSQELKQLARNPMSLGLDYRISTGARNNRFLLLFFMPSQSHAPCCSSLRAAPARGRARSMNSNGNLKPKAPQGANDNSGPCRPLRSRRAIRLAVAASTAWHARMATGPPSSQAALARAWSCTFMRSLCGQQNVSRMACALLTYLHVTSKVDCSEGKCIHIGTANFLSTAEATSLETCAVGKKSCCRCLTARQNQMEDRRMYAKSPRMSRRARQTSYWACGRLQSEGRTAFVSRKDRFNAKRRSRT